MAENTPTTGSIQDEGMLRDIFEQYVSQHSSNEDVTDFIAKQTGNQKLCEIAADYILEHGPTYKHAFFILKTFRDSEPLRKKAAKIIMQSYPNERCYQGANGEKIDAGFSMSLRWVIVFAPEFVHEAWQMMVKVGIETPALKQFMDLRRLPEPYNKILAGKASVLYLARNANDVEKLRFLIWNCQDFAPTAASRILESRPNVEDLAFLCTHAKDIGYLNAIEAATRILAHFHGLTVGIHRLIKMSDENLYPIIRGYIDFISESPNSGILSAEATQKYFEAAKRAAEMILKYCRPHIETLVHIMECLPTMRVNVFKAVCRRFGERGARQTLYHFRLESLIGEDRYPRNTMFKQEPDITIAAANWLLKNAKDPYAFVVIKKHVPSLRAAAQAKIDECRAHGSSLPSADSQRVSKAPAPEPQRVSKRVKPQPSSG